MDFLRCYAISLEDCYHSQTKVFCLSVVACVAISKRTLLPFHSTKTFCQRNDWFLFWCRFIYLLPSPLTPQRRITILKRRNNLCLTYWNDRPLPITHPPFSFIHLFLLPNTLQEHCITEFYEWTLFINGIDLTVVERFWKMTGILRWLWSTRQTNSDCWLT